MNQPPIEGSCERRLVDPEGRRERILRCAMQHFARQGFQGARLDQLAEEVGCAKGTLYLHFENKERLFTEAVDLVMREMLDRTGGCPSSDPLDRIEHAVRAYLAYFDEHPEYVELLIQERAEFRDRRTPTYFQYREAQAGRWKEIFRQLMDEGRIRRMPVERPWEVIGDLLYGTIFTNYFSGRRKSFEAQASDILDVVFRGLLTPEEAARRLESSRSNEVDDGATASRRTGGDDDG